MTAKAYVPYITSLPRKKTHTLISTVMTVGGGFVSDVTAYYSQGYTASLLTRVLGYDKLNLCVTSHSLKPGVSV